MKRETKKRVRGGERNSIISLKNGARVSTSLLFFFWRKIFLGKFDERTILFFSTRIPTKRRKKYSGVLVRLTFFVLKDVWMFDGNYEAHVAIGILTVKRQREKITEIKIEISK